MSVIQPRAGRAGTSVRRAILGAALALSVGCGDRASSVGEPDAQTAPRTSVQVAEADAGDAGIETVAARRVNRVEPLQAPGVVSFDERRTARLGSLVEGIVDELRVQVGDPVTRGATLARLHSHVVHDAWAGYFKAVAAQKRAETEVAFARTAESRAAQLVADRALSAQELERARADVNAAVQAEAAARAETTRARQELAHYGLTAQPDADRSADQDIPVRSPVSGTVVERLATAGMAVTPGTPLLVVADLRRVWVLAEIDESLLGRLTPGAAVTIAVAAYPGETFEGRLEAVGDTVNPATRRVTLRVSAANPERRLKPQMFATVTLTGASGREALVVPSRAVQAMAGEQVVFVRTAANRFERRTVTIGADVNGAVEVTSGLREGEIVAAAGAFLLKSELLAPAGDEEP